MQGRDYQLKLTANGLSGGTKKTVAYQGDLNLETGDGVTRTNYKAGYAYTAKTSSGYQITLPVLLEAPADEGLQLLLDAVDSGDRVYAYIESDTVGSQYWHGKFKVAMTTVPMGVDGNVDAVFTLSQDGTITRAVVA